MKRIIYFFAFALILGAYGRAYAQIDSITTTCNSAIIYFDSDFDTSQVDISVFRDTLIFEENFDNFLSTQVNNSTPIGAAGSLVTIPRSLTQFPGCRAMNLKIEEVNGNDMALLYNAKFATPHLIVPAQSVLEMKVQNKSNKTSSVKINSSTYFIPSATKKSITHQFNNECDSVVIEGHSSHNLYIDSL
ncbi:MAG: hypothetical protein PUJ75_07425, partial [Bacteroidales bacterium]|nr:hypothetical protein [Bacteroidales bacterium]MDY5789843.1 hypothetical protein [Candidatus Onthomorpha sp.]